MIATGESTLDNSIIRDDTTGLNHKMQTGRRIVWALSFINALALISVSLWIYFDRDAPKNSSPLLSSLRWWSQPWGQYVPIVTKWADSTADVGAAMLGILAACLSLLLCAFSVFAVRGRERFVLPALCTVVAICWVLIGTSWDVIRLRGQSEELVQYIKPVTVFAQQLDESWPVQEGEIEDFGAFLAYPYGTPRILLMLGDSHIPNTPLRVSAVERTPNQAIRFQLTGDAPDVWFEWRTGTTPPSTFRGGLEQDHSPKTHYKMTSNLFIVRYSIRGSDDITD